MELSDEDKLIVNTEMFLSIRKYIRENKQSAEIIAKIEDLLNEGADINACDNNDNNNTVLHIAAQKGNRDVVQYLLQRGARLLHNNNQKTALDLALETNAALATELAEILSEKDKALASNPTGNSTDTTQAEAKKINQQKHSQKANKVQEATYSKRKGTSGVSGQFYETKLLSLILYRALQDKTIDSFYLATNIKDIGAFDDLCFRFGNVACFMQAKHKENTDKGRLNVESVRKSKDMFSLDTYFESFLKLRLKFTADASDPMFQGKFEDIDTYFVLYTPLKEDFKKKITGYKRMCNKLHDIICTSENNESVDVFQFEYEEQDLDFLTSSVKNEHIKALGNFFLGYILTKTTSKMTMNHLIKIYHPALAQRVVKMIRKQEITNIFNDANCNNSNNIQMWMFRPEFFNSEDFNLRILKDAFCQAIIFTHSSKTEFSKEELTQKIQVIANNPCPETISTIIGSPVVFDVTTDKLSLDANKLPNNQYEDSDIQQLNYELQKIQVTATMVRNAVHIAGQKKLEQLTFELPQYFGNLDLTINKQNKEKVFKRLDFLADKFYSLIKHFAERNKDKQNKIIDISNDVIDGPDKILELSQLSSNGGIGGAVGNLLKTDKQTGLFTFNTKGFLNDNAKYVLEKLKSLTNEDMSKYMINVTVEDFPRDTFEVHKYDKDIAALFLSKLWFYTNQAQEESVERILKSEISMHYNADKQKHQFLFHVHSDAIFLRFHDEIQKWWKKQDNVPYLTKKTTIFDSAKKDIVDNPLLTVLNVMFIRKIKNIGIEFSSSSINSLNLDEFIGSDKNHIINIISDAVILSAAKIMQCKKYSNKFTFINLEYVSILPEDDRKTLIQELKLVKDMSLVVISDAPLMKNQQDTLLVILKNYKPLGSVNKKVVIITVEPIVNKQPEILTFTNEEVINVIDSNVTLLDLTSESQKDVLNKYSICYQGQNINLNALLDSNSMKLINAKLLWSILSKDKIEVGHTLETHKYDEIKNYYINRNLKRDGTEYAVSTLNDIKQDIVLICSKPCMGKSILLTHLSLETKKLEPKPWIVRVNLSARDKDIDELRYSNDVNAIMAFLCKAALKKPDEINKVYFSPINNETVTIDSKDVSFELQLFVQFYNSGDIVFLFDGFDRICPQNTTEGIKLFTAIEQAKKRMWITSGPYVIKILQDQFELSAYMLEQLSTLQQKSFLQRFWSTNLKLEKLNHDQFNNLTLFINYIRRTFNFGDVDEGVRNRPIIPMLSVPLHIIYLTLIEYFKNDVHSLSICYLREKIKKKWRLNSFTSLDRYLRASDSEESLSLTGTPLHMYIASNYLMFQVTDKFDLHLNTKIIRDRANVYIDAVSLYQQFLNVNIKHICEIENKSAVENNQENLRDSFFESHKKLALYAIFKEKDIEHILSESEIREVKHTIKMIESGELKTHLIDNILEDGIPRFYHLLFAEYFIVEILADILKRVKDQDCCDINLDSMWNFLVNVILSASPPSLRNTFDYKLKYDPELVESVSNEKSKNIIFNLLLKPSQAEEASTCDTDNALNIAINEGLVNVTNLLLKCVRSHVNEDNVDRILTIFKCSASILQAADTSGTILSDVVLKCIQNIDGETIIDVLNSVDAGMVLQECIKEKVVEPVKKFSEALVEFSGNNENLVMLLEQIPYHLPEFIRQFNEK